MLENSNTGVGGAKVDTNSALLCHFAKLFKARSEIWQCQEFSSYVIQVPQCLLVQELSSQSEENKSI